MSKNRVKILCPGLLALVLVAPAHAALYDVVDHGTYFTDTSTDGLNWLDLTTTYGKSFNEVSSGFEPGGQYEGYRYATVNEFGTMIESVTGIDLANTGQGTLENFPGEVFDDLMAVMDARNYSAATRIYAMFGDLSNGKQVNVLIRDYDNPSWNDDYNTRNAVTQSWMSENLGSLLVQTPSPVPIPAAFWLLGSGLLGLAGVAKRRKADSCD